MKTLKEYCQYYDNNEVVAIREWAIDNHKQQDLLTLIPVLADSQMTCLNREIDYMKTWGPNTVDMYLIEGVSPEEAHHFNHLFQCVIVGKEPNEAMMKWLQNNVPNRKVPMMFFQPAAAWLAKKGIRFKGEEDTDYSMFDRLNGRREVQW